MAVEPNVCQELAKRVVEVAGRVRVPCAHPPVLVPRKVRIGPMEDDETGRGRGERGTRREQEVFRATSAEAGVGNPQVPRDAERQ